VGLISRHRNRPSNNRLKAAIADQAFGIIRGLSGGGPAAAIDRSAGRPDCSHCRVRGDLRDGPRRELAKRFLIAERAALRRTADARAIRPTRRSSANHHCPTMESRLDDGR